MSETEKAEPTEEGPRDFAAFLRMLAGGDALRDLADGLHDIAKHMRAEAKLRHAKVKGSLAFTVNFTTDEKGTTNVSYAVKTTKPSPKTSDSVLWITKGGNMTPENPAQQKFDLREADGNDEQRDVDGAEEGSRSV